MAIPEEDRGPAWLRDYGGIEADISKMEEFATKLDEEVRERYAPHVSYVYDDMETRLPPPAAAFAELAEFLVTHDKSVIDTTSFVHFYQNATGDFANAATKVSEQYRQTDAFSAARLTDVNAAFKDTSAVTNQTPDSSAPSGSDPTIPDQQSGSEVP